MFISFMFSHEIYPNSKTNSVKACRFYEYSSVKICELSLNCVMGIINGEINGISSGVYLKAHDIAEWSQG
jgi:hypothetical protein